MAAPKSFAMRSPVEPLSAERLRVSPEQPGPELRVWPPQEGACPGAVFQKASTVQQVVLSGNLDLQGGDHSKARL